MNNVKKILLMEDDYDIAALLRLNLQDEGYQIVHEADGARARLLLDKQTWDAVILDLMLPNVNGLEICRYIRQMTRYLPVIIISARTSETHRVLGLEMGADDYLPKPFSIPELIARIKALFRRQEAMGQNILLAGGLICCHGLCINPFSREVHLHNKQVDLTPREFDLLLWFARHPGEVFSRLSLLDNVWGYQHEGYEHTVNTHINRLRAKIEQDAAVTCGVHIYSSNLYGNAMVQRLSAGLAQQIVITEPLLDNRGQVNHRTLKSLFERLMTLNPSVELYIVSPEGRLLVEAAPPGHIKRRYINIAPLKKFLSGAVWPVYGDDPRSVNKKKVFSTAPLYLRDDLKGYLYIILQGEELNALTDAAWTKALWNALYWSLFLVVICGLLSGMLVWYWVTRPIQQLTENVSGIEQDSISAIKQLAIQRPATPPSNEVEILHNAFIELARKISCQWDQLSESDQQRREFIANISHDLRTPLTSLLGYLETLSMKSDSLSSEDCHKYLTTALRQGHKVRHLSCQLFELARLEHGAIKPQLEQFSVCELIQDVAQKFELSIETRRLQLRIMMSHSLPLIRADISMIERVITNLLDNAVRHTPPEGSIRLKVWQEDNRLHVEVADSGPGLTEDMRTHLFRRASVLCHEPSEEPRGGLGLLIVRRMLVLHGGDIRLTDSTTGACFRFFLPL